MTRSDDGGGPLRGRGAGGQVTFVELFFDLVYVFAVTQLSHLLTAHLSWLGAIQTLVLLLAVWWAWVDTAWVTNWFDPDHSGVRLMLITVMLLSLVVSATIGGAFEDLGLWFAAAYAAMQVGRTAFAVAALSGRARLRRNFQRILAWKAAAGVLWVAGGFASGPARLALWAIAVAIEYLAAITGFYTPGIGRSTPADWQISGRHLAERCHLFIIIALGESILLIGSQFGTHPLTPERMAALVIAFLGTVALWWIYFDRSAGAAGDIIEQSPDPGRLGRSAYTYNHIPMVAGIIVTAVGDELSIAHPGGHAGGATIATILGGPALFLTGHLLFKKAVFGSLPLSRLVGALVLVALIPVGLVVPPLALAAAATATVTAVAVRDLWHPRTAGPAT